MDWLPNSRQERDVVDLHDCQVVAQHSRNEIEHSYFREVLGADFLEQLGGDIGDSGGNVNPAALGYDSKQCNIGGLGLFIGLPGVVSQKIGVEAVDEFCHDEVQLGILNYSLVAWEERFVVQQPLAFVEGGHLDAVVPEELGIGARRIFEFDDERDDGTDEILDDGLVGVVL